jgi:2-polyprenyl-3-methyl-5-hydroxy-6-metoxy-1,4-benzoquinol methylase
VTRARGSDRERWDAKHAAADEPDPPPSALLVESAAELPTRGRALDLACGRGRNAVWLARRGLAVEAVDVSPVALGCVADLAALHGVADLVRAREHDLARGLPALRGRFEVVICLHFRREDLWPRLPGLLAPGGTLLVETLARDASNLDVDASFLSERDELLAAAGGLEVLVHARGAAGKRAVDRLLARRVR